MAVFGNCIHPIAWHYHRDDLFASDIFFLISTGSSLLPIIFLNILTLVTVWRKPSFHSPSNIFICNLAISDLAVGVIAIPLSMAWKITNITSENTSVICAVGYSAALTGATAAGSSFLTLILATFDRYLALRYHLHYPTKVTTRRVLVVCVVGWLFSFVEGLSLFYGITVFDSLALSCMVPSMILLVVCYYKIYSIVHHHHNQIQAQVNHTEQQTALPNISRFKKTISVFVYLIIVFFLFYTPFGIVALYEKLKGYTVFYLHAYTISLAIIYVNSALNPIIYCWRLKEFRNAMKETLYMLFSMNAVIETR